MAVSMFGLILIPFIFTVLVVLLIKSPKAGAVSVGVLVFLVLAGLFGVRFLAAGAGGRIKVTPLFVMVVPFVFVLLVLLLTKAPKVGIGVLVALVAMGVAFFVAIPVSHRRAVHTQQMHIMDTAVLPHSVEPVGGSRIWLEAIDHEFDADVYPSKRAAVRAMGSRMDALIERAAGDGVAPVTISIFQEGSEQELAGTLATVVQERFPQAVCGVESNLRNTAEKEVGITLHLSDLRLEPVEWAGSPREGSSSGRIEATVFGAGGTTSIGRRFVEKPWVVDFASFANSRPGKRFAIARSRQSCVSENDAMEQSLADAAVLLTRMVGDEMRHAGPLGSPLQVTSTDVRDGDLIVDQFVQGLAGSASKIWRSALLIDTSGPKLTWLADRKSRAAHSARMDWARMIGSAVGVVALIAVIYFFLNMATRGYYEWSLRIAGVVLAIVAVISVLMMVR
ncbi:MAG: hypothetical protein JW741_15865 [Sedimentisphaerales bacterium]|nr:hypothetical protein [Sedimentisphaerales bacterium]